ncbi:MAG: hypothetical protein JNL12_18680 [Planctomycetes bacterium]|nr:hypothetical protein [Planctomycetota bacterium]
MVDAWRAWPIAARLLLAASAAVLAGAHTACATTAYAPCPVPWDGPLPDDAFERCKAVLERHADRLAIADRMPLRLQTGWVAADDVAGERRWTVLVDDGVEPEGLAVVVELRCLREPWLGSPGWGEACGDAFAERALAAELAEALSRRQP